MTIGFVDALLEGRLPPLDWTKDAFTAEAASVYHSGLYLTGNPGAGSVPSAGVNGAAVANGRTGTLLAPAAVSGKSCWLNFADFAPVAAAPGMDFAFLVDRLWENSGLSVATGAQAITPAALPARDANNAALGVGVGIAIEVVTTLGNGAPVVATLTYTNSSGTPTRTATATIPTTALAGTWIPFTLQAGDYGVFGPTSYSNASTLTSGTFSLVMYRKWGRKLRSVAAQVDSFGMADGGHAVPDGAAPHFIYHVTGTTVGATDATVEFAQG